MELPKRKQVRLPNYDYASNGAYFITICTKDRRKLLSRIRRGDPCGRPLVELSELGVIAWRQLPALEARFQITVATCVIMPDHIHLIFFLTGERAAAHTVGQMVGAYKSLIVREWRAVCNARGWKMGKLWQRGYFEYVLRNQQDVDETLAYIEGNPSRWLEKHASEI